LETVNRGCRKIVKIRYLVLRWRAKNTHFCPECAKGSRSGIAL